MGGMAGKLAMTLSMGLDFIGMGAFSGGSSLLDGSEADGTNVMNGGSGLTSGWSTVASTLATAITTAPDGTTTAARITEAATTDRHIIYQQVPGASPVTGSVTVSVYLKQNTRRYAQVLLAAGGTANTIYVYVDMQTGVISDSGVVSSGILTSSTIAAAVNGFYKVTMVGTVTAGSDQPYFIIAASDRATHAGGSVTSDNPSYTGDGTSSLYVWRPKIVD